MIEVLFFITFILSSTNQMVQGDKYTSYNRSMLQEKYPGFGEEFVIFPGKDGEYNYGYFKSSSRERPRIFDIDVEKDVTFTLYTRSKPKGFNLENLQIPENSSFNKKTETKFVTHGWMSSGTKDSCITIKDAFLNKTDVNVIIMDWSKIADNVFYPIPMKATSTVAEYYGKFLNNIIEKNGVKAKDIHLIGHSLGAHVSGFAARRVKIEKISRVTGLDPALPGFDVGIIVEGGHLKKTDADFVDVIHTCAGFLGIKTPLGHADFYPNGGGPPQPGCGNILEMIEACSHGRSWKLFAESIIIKKPYMATPCNSFEEYVSSKKCNGEQIPMGEPTPRYARGTFYLKTSDEATYFMDDYLRLDNVDNSLSNDNNL